MRAQTIANRGAAQLLTPAVSEAIDRFRGKYHSLQTF
jgi:hypothetical protein